MRRKARAFFSHSSKPNAWSREKLDRWRSELFRGEVVVAPAEGVYGYCCDPFNDDAIRKVISLKKRDTSKGFVVLVSSEKQLYRLVDKLKLDNEMKQAIKKYFPGNSTLILPAKIGVSDLLTGNRTTIAVRFPINENMQKYLDVWGKALLSTSLNDSGEEPTCHKDEIPMGVVALTLKKPLRGGSSKIYNTITGRWIR